MPLLEIPDDVKEEREKQLNENDMRRFAKKINDEKESGLTTDYSVY